MPDILPVALAQLNPAVGDILPNIEKLRVSRKRAATSGAQLIVTPELFLSGYPPEDLVLKSSFQQSIADAVAVLAMETKDGGPAILLGTPWRDGQHLYNAALLLSEGRILAKSFKHDLPNYGPFDEKRVFTAGPLPEPIEFHGLKLGVMICEDMWTPASAAHLKKQQAQLLLVLNGSPFEIGKQDERQELARRRVQETGLPLAYLNQIGGQDELVFDGESFLLDAAGTCCQLGRSWSEDLIMTRWHVGDSRIQPERQTVPVPQRHEAAIYEALMTGLRDYVDKNNFPGVVLGLSGGVDSALTAALAVDALGADRVRGVMLPSPYTSNNSIGDSLTIARTLRFRLDNIPITAPMETFAELLAEPFAGYPHDVTEENIQSRIRGLILMALSNKFGAMVLSTGNKSENAVGYATLYGDMCGGFAVLKDVYKTQVYALARWRNGDKPASARGAGGVIIPENVLTRAPTAELKPDQIDQDSLPAYEVLDGILQCLIERDMGLQDTIAMGYDAETVARVATMLNRAEYKRRQAPPGVKITRRLLGKDRRYPITNKFREA
ncbi:MAG: NAD+ synthase [Pseudomonadota bacterium]|nr:NAD+ synthase [Pseudomonadota bacterium]